MQWMDYSYPQELKCSVVQMQCRSNAVLLLLIMTSPPQIPSIGESAERVSNTF